MLATSGPRRGRFVTSEIDLDHLSATYRFRPLRAAGEARVLRALREMPAGSVILDVGGGGGDHAEVMRSAGYRPVILDPSGAQQRKAREQGLPVVGGVSQQMPFAPGVFDMAYFHLSLHYGDWRAAITESRRVVRPGGRVWIWTFSSEYLRTSFTGRWFPSVHRHDERRFPDPEDLIRYLAGETSGHVDSGTVTETVRRSVEEWEEVFRARFVSTLQMIDEAELEHGIASFREAFPDAATIPSVGLEFLWVAATVHE